MVDRALVAAKARLLSGEISWNDVCARVSMNAQARSDARLLRALVAGIQARDEAPAVVDDTCAYVFNTLRPRDDGDVDEEFSPVGKGKNSVPQNAAEMIRLKLGSVTSAKINEMADIVRKISDVLLPLLSPASRQGANDQTLPSSSFGSSIKLVIDDSLSDDDVDVYIDTNPWREQDEQQATHVSPEPSVGSSYTLDRAWLGKTIAAAFDGADIDVKDVTVTVFELLASTRSSDDLQFALFELLGERLVWRFERLSLPDLTPLDLS